MRRDFFDLFLNNQLKICIFAHKRGKKETNLLWNHFYFGVSVFMPG